MSYDRWPPYVSAAERKAKAAKHIAKELKRGNVYNPIIIEGRGIAKSFWGKAWCEHLESYSDYSSRLPRGRTYARNGSIIDFKISTGAIKAIVMGSSLYEVEIKIQPMDQTKWKQLAKTCAGKIDSLIELLQGKFSQHVMEILCHKENGLFPKPQEIEMSCSCPDYADMCKHVAAVLYGMGASLDQHPEWLFSLRHVDHLDLIAAVDENKMLLEPKETDLLGEDLGALFGIEIDTNIKIPEVKDESASQEKINQAANQNTLSKKSRVKKGKQAKKEEETIMIIVQHDRTKTIKRKTTL